MSKPALGIVGTDNAPDSWDEVMTQGAERALRQVLAKRPLAVVICYEPRGEKDSYDFVAFPPGVSAGMWICKKLAEETLNADE